MQITEISRDSLVSHNQLLLSLPSLPPSSSQAPSLLASSGLCPSEPPASVQRQMQMSGDP